MRGTFDLLPGESGTFVLVGSLLTAPTAWAGGTDLLATVGVSRSIAAVLVGLYVVVRSALSAHYLLQRFDTYAWLADPSLPAPTRSVVEAAGAALTGPSFHDPLGHGHVPLSGQVAY